MRGLPCAIVILFCLFPSSAISETAIGFFFLPERELSLWRVNDRSMIGAGLRLGLYNSGHITQDRKRNIRSWAVIPSLTVVQIYRSAELAPLSYQRASASIDRITYDDDRGRRKAWYAEGEIGIGAIWRPSAKNISLSAQQGVYLRYGEATFEGEATPEEENSTRTNLRLALKQPRLLVTISF